MGDCGKKSSVTIGHLFGTRFYLYFNKSTIFLFDYTVNPMVVN